MKVEIIRAWPRRFEQRELDLPEAATVSQAIAQAGWADDSGIVACAVHGQVVSWDAVLQAGDRLELLRALTADPKEARRQRANARKEHAGR